MCFLVRLFTNFVTYNIYLLFFKNILGCLLNVYGNIFKTISNLVVASNACYTEDFCHNNAIFFFWMLCTLFTPSIKHLHAQIAL